MPAPPAGGRTPRRADTLDPHRARERALRLLFTADVRGIEPDLLLERFADDPRALDLLAAAEASVADGSGPDRIIPLDGFTRRLVTGVGNHRGELDELLGRHARRWSVSRMPVVDRNVLRLAAYELLFEDTPAAVVIDEGVTLAKAFSTPDSGRYVNGVLEAIRRERDGTPSVGAPPAP